MSGGKLIALGLFSLVWTGFTVAMLAGNLLGDCVGGGERERYFCEQGRDSISTSIIWRWLAVELAAVLLAVWTSRSRED